MESPSSSAVSTSSLLCQESGINCLAEDEIGEEEEEEDPFLASLVTFNGFSDLDNEYVELMLQKEKMGFSPSSSVLFERKLTKLVRLDAINYILHTKSLLGFQFETAYLAVTYLDRFLSLRTLDSEKVWASELLCLGCVSLAAKLQESCFVGLSSFQVRNFRFELKAIQRMELLILSTLEWKMGSITPFSFLPYFINKLFSGPPPTTSTLTRILELILAIIKEISLMDHYPSSIASAAVLMTLDESLTRNALYSKINALPCNRFLDIDDVSICYLILQKSQRNQTKILKLIASPDLSPIKLTHIGSFQDSQTTSSISSKRRRLSFNGSVDKNQALSDESDI